ncbi:MAG: hypothetical protein Q4D04_02530 [Clostridia bacterium]|nr:hypothetical protein [Clostridia bacterium]
MRVFLKLLALTIAFSVVCAGAGAVEARNRVHFKLDASASFDEPLSRWLEELCDMAVLTTGYYWGEGGKYLTARLDMGSNRAIELNVIRQSGVVKISSNILEAPVMITGACDWADVMLDYAAFGAKTPSSGSLTPVSGEGLALALDSFSAKLRAMAAVARGSICRTCENCNACDKCELCDISLSLALFVDAVATRLEMTPDHNALLIKCDRLTGDVAPFEIENAVEAGDGLVVELIKKAIVAVCEATMANA